MAVDLSKASDEEILQALSAFEAPPETFTPEPQASGSRTLEQASDDEILQALGKQEAGGLDKLGMEISQGALNSLDVLAGIPEGAGKLAIGFAKFIPAVSAGAGEVVTGIAAGKPLTGLSEAGKRIKQVFEFGGPTGVTQFGGTIERVGASPFELYRQATKPVVKKTLEATGFEGTEEDIDNITEAVALFSFPAFLKTGKSGIGAIRKAVGETRAAVEALAPEAPVRTDPVAQRLSDAVGKPNQVEVLNKMGVTGKEEIVKAIVDDSVTSPLKTAQGLEKSNPEAARQVRDQAVENADKLIEADGALTEKLVFDGLTEGRKEAPARAQEPIVVAETPLVRPIPTVKATKAHLEFLDDTFSQVVDKGGKTFIEPELGKGGQAEVGGFGSDSITARWTQGKDFSKDQARSAIKAGLEERKLTERQQEILDDIVDASKSDFDVVSKRQVDVDFELAEGQKVEIDGEVFTKQVDKDGNVFLKDGETLGPLPDNVQIRVDKVLPREGEAPVLEAQRAREPRTQPTQPDFVGAREGLEGRIPAEEAPIVPGGLFDIEARRKSEARAEAMRQQLPLEEITEEIARTADEFIEETVPPAGLSIKKVRGVEVAPDVLVPEGTSVKGLFPEAEARKQAARGIKGAPITDRVKAGIRTAWQQTRHFEFLQSGAETKLGKKLFGEHKDGAIIEASRQFEAIKQAAEADTFSVLQGITARLKPEQYKVFTENLLLDDLARDINRGMYEQKPLPFGYEKAGDVAADLNNYRRIAEANPDVVTALEQRKAYMNTLKQQFVEKEQLPKEVLGYDQYFHHQVLAHLQHKQASITGGAGVRTKWRGWQKGREGSALDYNTEYLEAEFEVVSQALENLKRQEFLDKIEAIADVTPELKTRAKTEGVADFKDFLKDEDYADYVEWQPKEGSTYFKTNSIPEDILDQYVTTLREVDLADFREVLARGQKRLSLIIPERIGKQLDKLGTPRRRSKPEQAARFLNKSWKQWTLLMPLRAIKYFTNNLSGDFDITLAYDPAIVKAANIKQSYRELLDFGKGKRAPSKDIRNSLDRGVLSSGLTVQEIPEISSSGMFKAIEGQKASEGLIAKYWNNVRDFNNFRENLLRLAAYKHFIRELKNKPEKRLYGASKRTEMDAIYDSPEFGVEDYAGKLSRELIGDYGNVSQAGLWAREHLMPFYSWLEINAPRYVRLIKNLPHEGKGGTRAAGVAGGRLAKRAGGLAIKASLLAGAVNLWNHTMFPDAEKRLGDAQRRQLHIILGEREDGEIISMRFQGALSDALSWFAAEDLPTDIAEVAEGKASIGDKAKETVLAPVQKGFQALSPLYKTPVEAATGRATYPDVLNPRPIRDPKEHIAKTFSLDLPYRILRGRPSRGITTDLASVLLYNTDPGEAAYFTAKSEVIRFLEKKGKELPGFVPTKRANAVYYYKMALRYGDEKAAQKFKDEYTALGGTTKGMRQSVDRSSPLAMLSPGERTQFLDSLSPSDREMVRKAQAWFRQVFRSRQGTTKLRRGR